MHSTNLSPIGLQVIAESPVGSARQVRRWASERSPSGTGAVTPYLATLIDSS